MTSDNSWIEIRPREVVLRLRVQPKAGQHGLVGVVGGRLKLRVAEAPTRGQANATVVRLVAKLAGVPKSVVVLSHGGAARDKTLHISTLDPRRTAGRILTAVSALGEVRQSG